jgi:undecaprenyl-diphosphatase
MFSEIILAIVQAATEFLPISSSGHLALFSNLLKTGDLFLFTILHLASLFAVLIFTRNEIFELCSFTEKSNKLLVNLIIATIPAALVGFFFKDLIESVFSSYLFLSGAFFFTGLVILSTKKTQSKNDILFSSAFLIGLFQTFALFPGVSRSGMTISAGMISGLEKEKATRFSFLLLIPLVIGAVISETGNAYISGSLIVSFLVCLFLSYLFLKLLMRIVQKGKFWVFSIYCFIVSIVSLFLGLINL